MGGNGYSSDDNRSMQLNDNNDRYYSSRGIDRDDDYDDYDDYEWGGSPKPKAEFKGYIKYDDWFPYYKEWIKNLKINTGEMYEKEWVEDNGLRCATVVSHFTGFNYWNEQDKRNWHYYKVRSLIDYCHANNLSWTVGGSGLIEYKIEDWNDFAFNGENILKVNRIIYENNGLEFPSNAKEMFLCRIMTDSEKEEYLMGEEE